MHTRKGLTNMDSNYEYTWDSHTHTDRSYMSDSEVRDAISVSLHSMFFLTTDRLYTTYWVT